MLSEDQYLDRTPDLVAKVRKMREAAEKEMNRFTRVADYDVRRVVGRKPKEAPRPAVQLAFPTAGNNVQEPPTGTQTIAEIPSSAVKRGNHAEGV